MDELNNDQNGNLRIACIIVTYNRKELLIKCLNAVNSQLFPPTSVYIVDNASTDGTIDDVKIHGYYECKRNNTYYKYIRNNKNEGGAGGFYLGIKSAYDEGCYDAFWVMDDDGIPDTLCLKELCQYLNNWDFISPLVVSLNDSNILSFYDIPRQDFLNKSNEGIVIGASNPFNGVLFSKLLVDKVGFPMKEMFIWGDETNYRMRAENHGFTPITVINAIHYHPKDRQIKVKVPLLDKVIAVSDVDWKLYYYIRNMTYNYIYVDNRSFIIRITTLMYIMFSYFHFYTFKSQRNMNNIVRRAFWAGFRKDFRKF